MPQPAVLFLVGPTGSGKSALAVRLAKKINGEIISCDSMLVYKQMNIGTAKLSMKERQGVKHHLISIISPHETFSVNDFRKRALRAITEITNRGRVPIVAGGSGLYVRSLIHGLAEQPKGGEAVHQQLSDDLKRKGLGELYGQLQKIDPIRADEILPGDERRILRALEIFYLTKQRPSQWRRKRESLKDLGYRWVIFGLDPDRGELYEKINARVLAMMKKGFLAEVKRLSKGRLSQTALQAIGYHEMLAYLKGQLVLKSAIERTQQRTRQLAKKQWIWFRKEKGLQWIALKGNSPLSDAEKKIIREWQQKKENVK
ncbi:MAG: tRNA (adenosine(37)-N6)-dimethylallyltransferase MiaA [Candidatus Omnitrophica bacterium CG11_big_fil_rev_8_21_14_0_20_45_26]|uniref:tRNA dimethylallyltransferase n=1 Tax=Candidatus Abzuiibacterium crystallinum TaxID=1974748 RepID=A0A2H0LLS6_9BACT|nr:MAG: tRNA (adenosine(37)-N6)-dimethylallyltransferase MiaA [Candidatus Omnitrophica bacterium CG11_big_fil_rev_8_21_14_0_20_45_26]PIW63231.1 MAG: tRNA (adenosine(37)-N6)-dimethylallyltransferase MiaA [Candidatus Omnitrophica bacterium CG12_big_fil_rev_8_21_14_0_65_45_16]